MLPNEDIERHLKATNTKAGHDTFCDTPIAKGKVTFPDKLAGRANTKFDMYSGYVNIYTENEFNRQKDLFYWFFGTQVFNHPLNECNLFCIIHLLFNIIGWKCKCSFSYLDKWWSRLYCYGRSNY